MVAVDARQTPDRGSLGLIGDKYIEIRGGSVDAQPIEPGGRINIAGLNMGDIPRVAEILATAL